MITCSADGCDGRAQRIEPVLDAWFDSGSMPSAQFHFPSRTPSSSSNASPPTSSARPSTRPRGWFYSLLAVNTLVFGHTPYRNVVCLGLLLDQDGQKMSKSRGNVIDPRTVLESRGADALRWNMFSATSPWAARRVNVANIDESTRRFLLTLWNTYSFFVTYARARRLEPDASSFADTAAATHVLDRWILSRSEATSTAVTDALEPFDALGGAQALDQFVGDLSNWYVRRSRSRFWKSADPAAHTTLHHCLVTVTLLLAPYCPFITDEMYANLAGTDESVHLADWPVSNPARATSRSRPRWTSPARSRRSDTRLAAKRR